LSGLDGRGKLQQSTLPFVQDEDRSCAMQSSAEGTAERDMTETPPAQTPSSPKGSDRRRGVLLRILLASAAPAILLAAAGILIARSISPDSTGPLAGSDFTTLFLLAAVLAVLLALLLAVWINIGIRSQLGIIIRALRTSRAPEVRGLATGDAWGAIGTLAEEAQNVLARVEEGAKSTAELERLHQAADGMIEKIRSWEETESPPELEAGGPLARMTDPLRLLAERLRDRDREAREAAELTRETAAEARVRIERASREAERASLEVASLMQTLGELKRIGVSLMPLLRASPESDTLESEAAATARQLEEKLRENLEQAAKETAGLVDRLNGLERRAIRATLQQAAGRLLLARWASEHTESATPSGELPVLELAELRQLADESHEGAVALAELRGQLEEALKAAPQTRSEPVAVLPDPLTAERLELSQRFEQAIADTQAKGERLAALSERATRHAAQAVTVSESTVQDLQGLSSRFLAPAQSIPNQPTRAASEPETSPAKPPGDVGTEAQAPVEEEWKTGSTPLRLLTREDVLPDEEPAAAEETDDPPGKGVGDV
jgi:hypothetical protein